MAAASAAARASPRLDSSTLHRDAIHQFVGLYHINWSRYPSVESAVIRYAGNMTGIVRT